MLFFSGMKVRIWYYTTKPLDEHLESMGEFEDIEDQDGNMEQFFS